MSQYKVSLFASSVRPQLYESFFKSLEGTSVEYEVVFAGNVIPEQDSEWNLKYIITKNLKPAQCYEIARRACKGELVVWVADDCEFPNDVIGKAYREWKKIEKQGVHTNNRHILSLQTKEADAFRGGMHLPDMKIHSFFGGQASTPLMAPIGMMSREYLDSLGGFDRRYMCGQYENDLVMRANADGGFVHIFGDKETFVEIDHHNKHGGERAFHKWYPHDRKILEKSWTKIGLVVSKRNDEFEPYEDKDLLTITQSHKGDWE